MRSAQKKSQKEPDATLPVERKLVQCEYCWNYFEALDRLVCPKCQERINSRLKALDAERDPVVK